MAASPNRASIYPVLAADFVGTIGFSIVLPFLVYLITRLGGNAVVYGVMEATYSLFQLLGAPLLGRLSDRYGRRRVLLLSQVGTFIAWGIFLLALWTPVRPLMEVDSVLVGTFTLTVPLLVLFFSRALDGFSGGNVSVANAYLADISDDTNRSANFGLMGMWSNLGFILGPAIAGVLGALQVGETLPVLAAFAISAVACFIIAFGLPETRPCILEASPETAGVRKVLGPDRKDCFTVQAPAKLSMLDVLRLPSIGSLLTVYFMVYLAFNFFYVGFPIYAATGVKWSLAQTGTFFSVLALMMALVQGPVLKWASRRWSDRARVLGGSLILAASFPFFNSADLVILYAGNALLALGNGIMWPSLLAILARAADRRVQGTVQGYAGSIAAIASIIGLLLGGFLYRFLGAYVFVISGGLTLLTFIFAFAIPTDTRTASTT